MNFWKKYNDDVGTRIARTYELYPKKRKIIGIMNNVENEFKITFEI